VRNSVILLTILSLAACGDPLSDFERIEDIELADDVSEASILPDPEDEAPRIGVLARILKRESEAEIANVDIVDEPSSGIESETNVEDDAIEAAIASVFEEEKPSGVRGWLQRAAAESSSAGISENKSEIETPAINGPPSELTEVMTEELVEPQKRLGLFNLLKISKDKTPDENIRTASLQEILPEEAETTALVEPKKKRSLFGNSSREIARKGPDAQDVSFGTTLPYGEVARVCDAKGQEDLGRRLGKAPASGRGYALYDSAPDTTGPRTFYITGFKDRCPRQFTAALALFGSPEVHEQLRYGRPSKLYPYSTTDKAYEKVKSSVCKVGKNKPCGAKLKTLERNTVFISTYEKFSDNARWADILLHDGIVAAAAIKTP